jgi:hypothetical protein
VLGDPNSSGRLQLKRQYVERLPIPHANNNEQLAITSIVEKILAKNHFETGVGTSALERELDDLVFNLYGFSSDEQKSVEEGIS